MTEWMVDIETTEGLTVSVDDLTRFAESLDAVRNATGAATGLDRAKGSISASFTVSAADAAGAADRGVTVFRDALVGSGLGGLEPARIAVERVELGDAVPA